ncbi:hypothetical protein [Rickettsia felis]|uniref:hypothetical protein n=1 Tax=Rickettsia felis TaxID=42862 RepID=UPI000B204F87|nr:hypothetical protein [Rickettsia felis]
MSKKQGNVDQFFRHCEQLKALLHGSLMSFPRGIVAWISNRHCEERSFAAIQKK